MADKVHLLNEDNYSSFEMPNKIDVSDIIEMFKISNVQEGFSMEKLNKFKGVKGLAKCFKTDLKKGLPDEDRVNELRGLYGAHIPVQKKLQSLCSLIIECLADTMLQVLLVAAVLSIIVNGFSEEGWDTGWMEGVTILFAVVLIISITAGNNYAKQKQFRQLQNKLDESKVEVMRNGQVQLIDSKQLVVGDLLLFRIGNIFTVDGLLVQGSEIKIDESSLTGESVEIKKSQEDPFLLSGTKVVDGTGLMLVLTVGENTIQGQMIKLMQQENPPTPLQSKLESVAEDIGKLGTLIAILTFLALVINYFVDCGLGKAKFASMETLQAILNALMIGVTIIVVAVPEGLPLAVTITLAFSVNRMKNEQNLVKTLASCEIMGGANNICSDKTGTLTQNVMTVVALWAEDRTNQNSQLSQQTVKILCESICYNSEANPIKTNKGLQQIGNKTECALLQLADNFGYNYKNYRPSQKIIKVIPFNSSRKRMITLVDDDSRKFAFVKGASEQILAVCTNYIGQNDQIIQIDQGKMEEIRKEIIENFANQSLRTIAIAYKEISDETQEEDQLVENLTLIGIAGIKDPIRNDVVEAIKQCSRSEITVRMVTGDNILTAQAIAKDCGILDKDYKFEAGTFEVMSGQEFRETVGGLKEIDKVKKLRDPNKFQMVTRDLKVLARATPEDKYLLVTGLIELENVVAVTGDGTNDAPALRKADVGFAMGISGSEVAREAADIILMDDNFSSIITACKWGRNIYDCIRKFIQFQLTVNVVALFMSVLGAAISKQAPLNAIQMLWVNLIMDTFASLALATEPPSASVLNRAPYGRRENIVNSYMYRTIIGQSLYQIIVLCFLLFGAQNVLDLETPEKYKNDEKYQSNVVQLSFFFQTFVLMQVFNSITCRRLDNKHPFYNLFNNWMFWVIQLITIGVQFLLMYFGGAYVQVVGLNWQQNLISLGLGAFGLIIGMIVKLIPLRVFNKINVFRENQLDEKQMDQTVTSVLRRRSTVRMKSSVVSQPILSKQGSMVLKQQSSQIIEQKN